MGQLILAALVGALLFFFLFATVYYRSQVKDAEAKRDEAVTMSARALEAKQGAEEGFTKLKQVFEERMKLPLIASMTDEQCNNLGNFLAEKLFMSNVRTVDKVQ